VTALVGLFCVGLVKDTCVSPRIPVAGIAGADMCTSADTLYLCYCIDKEAGERRRAEVFEMVRLIRRPEIKIDATPLVRARSAHVVACASASAAAAIASERARACARAATGAADLAASRGHGKP
jgi:hypothetical protein